MKKKGRMGMFVHLAIVTAGALAACGPMDAGPGEAPPEESRPPWAWDDLQTPEDRVATVGGFSGPEAVRYDPDQDVWFVGNMNGGERDGDGFISRVAAETSRVEVLHFAEGTPEHPLHAPRGMVLTGDTLWVADMDGVHGFDRRSGRQLAFVDLSAFEPGFLNDIARGADGALYLTDTGKSVVFRLGDAEVSAVLEGPELGSPNGITWDPSRSRLVMVPWEPGHRILLWRSGQAPEGFGPRTTPGRLDGIEPIDRRLLVASQSDSALHLVDGGGSRTVVRVGGAPADIGLDTRRRRVAVPYIALNRVDIWQLPGG